MPVIRQELTTSERNWYLLLTMDGTAMKTFFCVVQMFSIRDKLEFLEKDI